MSVSLRIDNVAMWWYAVARGTEFKFVKTDPEGALRLRSEGWEIGAPPFDDLEKAKDYIRGWKQRADLMREIHNR